MTMYISKLVHALPNAENTALLMEAKNGDMDAREKFFKHNQRLMVYIANRFKNSGHDFEDLFSASQLGFLKAFNSFDITKGVSFATYSRRCMENEILMFMQANKRHRKNYEHLEYAVAHDQNGVPLTVADIIPHPEPSSLALEESDALRYALRIFQTKTSKRNCLIISLRFEKELEQHQIAERTGLSQSYISRIIKQSLLKIQQIEARYAQ